MCVESSKNKETTQQRSFTIPQSGSFSTIPEGEAKGGGGGGWRGVGKLSLFISQGQVNSIKINSFSELCSIN